ncbi:hypothetical protein LO772_07185 [Yinghuangia sp. ASG 101]|uniref:hypothetical protein n=1 Tax=Yinghuangia sp. ASG 101 TaxID=2896848 RepID=UPI001E375862|nr:hypothetical protein [Yinghuangia sp. ASG 101]UGQ13384.1 hypothetical protein LO772_07185 [Yinghuangia sp. ASG 101]
MDTDASTPTPPRTPVRRTRRISRTVAVIAIGAAVIGMAGCGKKKGKETDFDTFVKRHLCQNLVRGGDGDIDLSCVDPETGKRVDIEFEANDRPGQYFTDTPFGGSVYVFAQAEVRNSKIYSKIKKG